MDSTARILGEIWFVNVGQGDCTLAVDHLTRKAILVDCPSWAVEAVARLIENEAMQLDTALVTHWDLDHYGGLARLSKRFLPRVVAYNHDTLFPDGPTNSGKFIRTTLQQFLDLVPHGVELCSAEDGRGDVLGHLGWSLLAPTHDELTRAYIAQQRNIASAVLELRLGGTRVLVGGDAVASTWRRLLDQQRLGPVEILRWPHHGASLHGDRDWSVGQRVLDSVNPRHVVVSVGTHNNHHHPNPDVVTRASKLCDLACTQKTQRCLDARGQGSPQPRSSPREGRPCGGTMRLTVASDLTTFQLNAS